MQNTDRILAFNHMHLLNPPERAVISVLDMSPHALFKFYLDQLPTLAMRSFVMSDFSTFHFSRSCGENAVACRLFKSLTGHCVETGEHWLSRQQSLKNTTFTILFK